jgi:hypothetical protein
MKIKRNPEWVQCGLGASTRVRNMAKNRGVMVDKAVNRYLVEGGVRRIFDSDHADDFGFISLKGGSLMYFHEGVDPMTGRGTKDIDLQVSGFAGTIHDLQAVLQKVLAQVPAHDDGLRFFVDHLTVDEVHDEDEPVPGGKVTVPVQLGEGVYMLKIDVGMYAPEQKEGLEIRVLESLTPKHLPGVTLYAQRREYALADKVQAMVRKGIGNSRLRDYYDAFVMLTLHDIDVDVAAQAFAKVFPLYQSTQYGFEVPTSAADIPALSATFAAVNEGNWQTTRAKHSFAVPTPDLATVCDLIRDRIQPILDTVHAPGYGAAA